MVSLVDLLALLEDVGEGESPGSVTGDWRSRPKVEGEGTMDPSLFTLLPGLVTASDSAGLALFRALWSRLYDSLTVAHHEAMLMPVGRLNFTSNSSALEPASGTGIRANLASKNSTRYFAPSLEVRRSWFTSCVIVHALPVSWATSSGLRCLRFLRLVFSNSNLTFLTYSPGRLRCHHPMCSERMSLSLPYPLGCPRRTGCHKQ